MDTYLMLYPDTKNIHWLLFRRREREIFDPISIESVLFKGQIVTIASLSYPTRILKYKS